MSKNFTHYFIIAVFPLLLASCSTSRQGNAATPRDKYEDRQKANSVKNDPALSQWRNAGVWALSHPLSIPNAYFESGRFYASDSTATAFLVSVKRGQKLTAAFQSAANSMGRGYLDIWKYVAGGAPQFIAAADTSYNYIETIAGGDVNIIVRFQGQIGFAGNYILDIHTGPSLMYPIPSNIKAPVGSFFGDGRDNGSRKHEGVDIMAPKHSPAIAAAEGVIIQVGEDSLGGKVVSMQPAGTNLSLYYAHLDSQFVVYGQKVHAGDVLGITGNTGNARYTVSHLHFGIYSSGIAVDPLLFIRPAIVKKVTAFAFPANSSFAIMGAVKLYPAADKAYAPIVLSKNSVVTLRGISDEFYRVALIDGRSGFILKSALIIK